MGHACERAVTSGFVKLRVLRVGLQEMLLAQSNAVILQLVRGPRIGFITYQIFSCQKKTEKAHIRLQSARSVDCYVVL